MSEYYDMQNDDSSVVSYDISIIPNDFNVLTIKALVQILGLGCYMSVGRPSP